MKVEDLAYFIRNNGKRFPKKHGEWRRIHAYDNIYLLLDTWNGHITIHRECEPSDTNNMYRVVYVFSGKIDYVKDFMAGFWYAHVYYKNESR